MNHIKETIKRFVISLGYELKKLPHSDLQRHQLNAFADQQELLKGRPVETILDLGANIGKMTAKYMEMFPAARIHSFEPGDEAFTVISERFATQPSVHLVKKAVSIRNGFEKFFVNKFNPTSSLLPVAQESGKYVDSTLTENVETVEVETVTLDGFCRDQDIKKINILKMDIQGGELMALCGAEQLLAHRAIDLIYTEVLFAKLYEHQAYYHGIADFLTQRNYVLYGLYNCSYGRNGVLAWADAIFLSPEIEASLK